MDKFIGYSPELGFMEFDNSDDATAEQYCSINDLTYIGYKKRFIQNVSNYICIQLTP